MGWTKADREKFLASCDKCADIMPREAIRQNELLFDDVIETDNNNSKIQKIRLVLKYPPLNENIKGDPMAKQSARFTVERYRNGINKGKPVIYKNKLGIDDVIIKSYPEPKIVNTTKMLRIQIENQLKKISFTKYRGAIFITRMEFIFKVSENAPKYMINDIKEGKKIYFKDTKPDLDNLEKLIWDAMQMDKAEKKINEAMFGLVYDNDAQIVSKNGIFKRWGIIPGVIIEMEGLI